MAIKGKRKSQQRGSQARRRPAQAPRPAVGTRRRPPWYRTTAGQVIASLVFLVVAIAVIAVVAHVRSSSKERSQSQSQLETYTGKIRSVLATITPDVTAMTGAPSSSDDAAGIKALDKSTDEWAKTFEGSISEIGQAAPAAGAADAQQVFSDAVQLYSTVVQTLKVVPSVGADEQTTLLGLAQAQLAQATQLWTTGVQLLDQARSDVGLD
ncbi:MAG: hypothetical protein M3290_04205, partial [Actinomycetota bacterium]|nr:hypothetical protein [Actinomycetota bacterium]